VAQLDTAPVVEVAVDRIAVGPRRRQKTKVGRRFLASIADHGLINPIMVRSDGNGGFELVSGERRLEAAQRLGWKTIPATVKEVDNDELRDVELDENVERENFTPFERSVKRLREVEGAEEEPGEESGQGNPAEAPAGFRKKRGPPRDPKSKIGRARAAGVPRRTIDDALNHTEAVKHYPFLASAHWSQTAAIQVAKALGSMEPGPRLVTVEMMESVLAVDASDTGFAYSFAANMVSFSPEKQRHVAQLYRGDERERELALSIAAAQAPRPDPRLVTMGMIDRELDRLLKQSKDELRDDFVEGVKQCRTILSALEKKVRAADQERVETVAAFG
jgi:hypothetical protein